MTSNDNLMLNYRNTNIPIRLGDRIRLRRFFVWRPGVVSYVPGQSSINPAMEDDDEKSFGIRLDSMPFDIISILYLPSIQPAPKNLVFVSRGKVENELKPDDQLT